jgi:hypothetical protein
MGRYIVTTYAMFPEDRALVERLANNAGCSRSEVVRTAVRLLAMSAAVRTDGKEEPETPTVA